MAQTVGLVVYVSLPSNLFSTATHMDVAVSTNTIRCHPKSLSDFWNFTLGMQTTMMLTALCSKSNWKMPQNTKQYHMRGATPQTGSMCSVTAKSLQSHKTSRMPYSDLGSKTDHEWFGPTQYVSTRATRWRRDHKSNS